MSDPPYDDPERILLVDDNAANLQVLVKTLGDLGHQLYVAKNGERALAIAQSAKPTIVMLDIMMPDGLDGYEVCRLLKENPATRDAAVIFLSALDDVEEKVKGLGLGAVDFVTKPFQAREIVARVRTQITIHRLRRTLKATVAELSRELEVVREMANEANRRVEGPLLGSSEAISSLRESLASCAKDDSPLLLTGAPGSGHEAVARAVHLASERRSNPFFYVNCSTLEADQATSLLGLHYHSVGDELGSPGAIAEGGTVFLDQVHQLLPEIQQVLAVWLRRAREAREKGTEHAPNVRIIAHAFSELAVEVRKGTFAAALLRELQHRHLHVPALRERRDDIPVLAEYYLKQHAARLGRVVEGIEPASMRRLQTYSWPGSVQELRSLVERRLTMTHEPLLTMEPHFFEGIALGGYQLVEKLGQGGMGEVWRAKHQLLARPAAVKLVRPHPAWSTENLVEIQRRFEREARATANLHSPNTVHLYDFGVDETDGTFYYVMELLRGLDLGEMSSRFGPMPAGRVVMLLRQACRSLAEAHGVGLVHRDIKPANLFVCRLGLELDVLKVLDFGVVKGDVTGDQAPTATEGVRLLGTPGYIAPEMFLGNAPTDARADLYALGCVAYLLLTGSPVFTADHTMGIMAKHITDQPVSPSQLSGEPIPPDLESLILSCLEKDPDSRPNSALDVSEALAVCERALPWTQEHALAWWECHVPEMLWAPPSRRATEESLVETDQPPTQPIE
jgi:eukaryotic-like serine/threonine-protein kinase